MSKPTIDATYSSKAYSFASKDVPWLMKKNANESADKVFIIWEPKGGNVKQWTYAEFWVEANKVACGLIDAGVKKGDKVLIHAENSPEMMIAWYASAIMVP